jgi:hypothetical protein
MKFKPDVNETQISELEQALDDLPNQIVEIHGYEFGRDIVHSERSYDFALVSMFANLEALGRYQKHPAHLKVLSKIKAMVADVAAVDFETRKLDPIQRNPLETKPF